MDFLKLQTTILLSGLLANPVVSRMDPEELCDAALAFVQLIDQRSQPSVTNTGSRSISPDQVALLERMFNQPS